MKVRSGRRGRREREERAEKEPARSLQEACKMTTQHFFFLAELGENKERGEKKEREKDEEGGGRMQVDFNRLQPPTSTGFNHRLQPASTTDFSRLQPPTSAGFNHRLQPT